MFTRTSHSNGPTSPRVDGFYDPATGSVQYVASDPDTKEAALIDIVQDFDPASARSSFHSAQTALDFVRENGLTVTWILDTHPHADHLMAQAWLKERTGAPTGIGEKVRDIAALWADIYNLPEAFDPERDFDRLFADGETVQAGRARRAGDPVARPYARLGHLCRSATRPSCTTPSCMSMQALPAPIFPAAPRQNFTPRSSAFSPLPDDTRLFVGHDYPPVGERNDPAWEASVAEHRAHNKHVGGGVTEAAFRELRDESRRDAAPARPDAARAAGQSARRPAAGPGSGRSALLQDTRQQVPRKEHMMKTETLRRRHPGILDPGRGARRRSARARSC